MWVSSGQTKVCRLIPSSHFTTHNPRKHRLWKGLAKLALTSLLRPECRLVLKVFVELVGIVRPPPGLLGRAQLGQQTHHARVSQAVPLAPECCRKCCVLLLSRSCYSFDLLVTNKLNESLRFASASPPANWNRTRHYMRWCAGYLKRVWQHILT